MLDQITINDYIFDLFNCPFPRGSLLFDSSTNNYGILEDVLPHGIYVYKLQDDISPIKKLYLANVRDCFVYPLND